MSGVAEESPEVRRNKILGAAIGLDHLHVAKYVVSIRQEGDPGFYMIHFSIDTPDAVRRQVKGLGGMLYVSAGPIDFQGLQYSKI